MQDPIAQFPNAGFDSPEVQAQIDDRMAQLSAAFEAFAETCRQVWQVLTDALRPLLDFIIEQGKIIARNFPYLIPRQYRLTPMRRKIRRYAREIGKC